MTFAEAVRTWFRIGLLSFGGPAGQIAVMHRILVDEKRWIGEERFLHALNYCMLLPGPEAQQLATYIGWLLHGTRGGLAAGALFVLPGFLAIMAFSVLYVLLGRHLIVEGLFLGLKAAVIALVLQALLRIGARALRNTPARIVAGAAFIAIALLHVPFPLIVFAAGLVGYAASRSGRPGFATQSGPGATDSQQRTIIDDALLNQVQPTAGRAIKLLALWLPLWWAPVGALLWFAGPGNVFAQLGVFFSKMAVVTFGGAYAVLAYVAQEAVGRFAWISPGQMVDGLALAESTPGPLILVLQFVGFLAAYQSSGGQWPLLAGLLGALLTVWVTFVPCFLWIFLGAPYVERLRSNAPLRGALAAITAAVVGVIANLALWFATHVLFGAVSQVSVAGFIHVELPQLTTLAAVPAILAATALLLLFALRAGLALTLATCAILGVAASVLI